MSSTLTAGSINTYIKISARIYLMKIKDFYFTKLMLYIYRRFFEKHPLILLFLFGLFLNIISWILVSIKGRPENYIIPLHYLSVKGVDKTGPWYLIYQIPLAGLLILVINFMIIFNLSKKNIKDSFILSWATVILELFLILASYLIVFRV